MKKINIALLIAVILSAAKLVYTVMEWLFVNNDTTPDDDSFVAASPILGPLLLMLLVTVFLIRFSAVLQAYRRDSIPNYRIAIVMTILFIIFPILQGNWSPVPFEGVVLLLILIGFFQSKAINEEIDKEDEIIEVEEYNKKKNKKKRKNDTL